MKNLLRLNWFFLSAFLLCVGGLSAGCGSAPTSWWQPTPGLSWQIQLVDQPDISVDVKVFDLDLFDVDKEVIDRLHSQGRKVICYFSGGTYEDWRSDAKDFPPSLLGSALIEWQGEKWLNIRFSDALRPMMNARLDLAAHKGCDAVDVDNMNGYENLTSFMISPEEQLAYNRMIAEEAHKRGLAIGLKNDVAQISELVDLFDFAVNESCVLYKECDLPHLFITHNKPVFGIEYSGTTATVCPESNSLNFDTLIKNLNLDSYRVSCR